MFTRSLGTWTVNAPLHSATMIDPQELASAEPATWASIGKWSPRRWAMAAIGAGAVALMVGLPTDVIPNPVFGRPVPVTWWSYPTLVVTAVLSGLLFATYVREPGEIDIPENDVDVDLDRPGKLGGFAGLVSFFAVGCPVCNKIVLIALGATGARQWFEPFQPLLAVGSIVLLAVALRIRLKNATSCPIPGARPPHLNGV